MSRKTTTTAKKKKPAPARKVQHVQRNEVAPQPRSLGDGEIEVSGVWGRVRYREDDPFAEVREIFDHYDRNKSGLIEAKEFARILEALGMEMEEHELKVAFLDVDHDSDGKIGWDEFVGWWKSMRA